MREKYYNINYLKSSSIHASQNSNWEEDGCVTIELNIYPDSDLVRKIRSLGSHTVKVIEPEFY